MLTSRLLMTGAGGFLGRRLCSCAVDCDAAKSIVALVGRSESKRNYVERLGVLNAVVGDLSDAQFVKEQLEHANPIAIIHVAALAHPAQCEQNAELSLRSNVRSTQNIAQVCAQLATPPRLIFVSSEQVFSGRIRRPYTINDSPDPINVYGLHKALAEQYLQTIYPLTRIVRLPLLYGSIPEQCTKINHKNDSDPIFLEGMGFVGGVVRAVLAGQEVNAFADEFRPPAHVDDVAQGLLSLAQLSDDAYRNLPKILHLGGPQVLSRLTMAQLIVNELESLGAKVRATPIRAITRVDAGLASLRPEYLDLESAQSWSALGLTPRAFANGLRSFSSSI